MDRVSRKDMLLHMLELEPNDVFLNYALSQELMGVEDYANANLQLQKTLLLDKNYLACYYQLGQVNEKLNDIPQAMVFYKQGIAVASGQNNKKTLAELSDALWQISDED